ncbi:hypothetical protein pb186bvf_011117 [Paramecium bursaria]
MDTKQDIIIRNVLSDVDPPKKEEKIQPEPQFNKHKLQCGGSTFEIYDHYDLIKNVGIGAYGVVCSGKDKLRNTDIAIKKVCTIHYQIPGLFRDIIDAKRVLREIKLSKFFNHDNIVKLLDIILPDDPDNFKDMYLVFPLMQTDLDKIIKSKMPLNDVRINWIMYQIISGLYYMHSAHIIHRDLKPNNIFINSNCHLKIGDLNLARKQLDEISIQTDYVVTRWYRAPEVLFSQSEYTASIDIWSIGCILAELLGRTILFQGRHPREQVEKIIAVLGKPKPEDTPYQVDKVIMDYIEKMEDREAIKWIDIFPFANPLALDLLQHMLVYNPNKRFNIKQCIEHEYFKTHLENHPPKKCEEVFDWTFDSIELKEKLIRQELYKEALCS